MVSLSPGWNFALGMLKYCNDYTVQFQPGHKMQISMRIWWDAKTQPLRMLVFLFKPGLKKWQRVHGFFSPGWNPLVIATFILRGLLSEPGLSPANRVEKRTRKFSHLSKFSHGILRFVPELKLCSSIEDPYSPSRRVAEIPKKRGIHKEYVRSFFPIGFEMLSNKHLHIFPTDSR